MRPITASSSHDACGGRLLIYRAMRITCCRLGLAEPNTRDLVYSIEGFGQTPGLLQAQLLWWDREEDNCIALHELRCSRHQSIVCSAAAGPPLTISFKRALRGSYLMLNKVIHPACRTWRSILTMAVDSDPPSSAAYTNRVQRPTLSAGTCGCDNTTY